MADKKYPEYVPVGTVILKIRKGSESIRVGDRIIADSRPSIHYKIQKLSQVTGGNKSTQVRRVVTSKQIADELNATYQFDASDKRAFTADEVEAILSNKAESSGGKKVLITRTEYDKKYRGEDFVSLKEENKSLSAEIERLKKEKEELLAKSKVSGGK